MESLESKYEIEKTLTGGQAIVYKARDKVLDRLVAIKTPNESVMSDPHKLEKFIEEGRKMARLKDENVLRVLHFVEQGEFDEKCYLITEWMDQTLEETLQNEDLDMNTATSILTRILKGVHALHNAGIVHRDLKPSNIYLSADGSDVRIADLGIASDVGADETLTATPKYIAPEIYQTEGEVDRRSDLYSLGILAYEMYLGSQRFKQAFAEIYNTDSDKTRNARWLNWHLDANRSVPELKDMMPDFPEKHSGIVKRMMAKDPAARFSSADEILREFGEIHQSDGVSFTPLPIPGQSGGESEQKSWRILLQPRWIALQVAVLLAIIIAISYPYSSGDIRLAEEAGTAMKAAYDRAVAAGAKTPPIIAEFEQGEVLRESGIGYYDESDYDLAVVDFVKARKLFEQSEVLAWQRRIEKVRNQAEAKQKLALNAKAGEPDPVEAYTKAETLLAEAVQTLEKKQYKATENSYLEAGKLFVTAIEQALLRRVEQVRNAAIAARDAVPAANLPLLKSYSANYISATKTWDSAELLRDKKAYMKAIVDYELAAAAYLAAMDDIAVLTAWQRMLTARKAVIDAGIKKSNQAFANAEKLKQSGLAAFNKTNFQQAEQLFDQTTAAYQAILGNARKPVQKVESKIQLGSTEQEIDTAMALCRQHVKGCKRQWYASERLRDVQLKPFVIDATEVTNSQFTEFVEATGHVTKAERRGTSRHWLQGVSVTVKGYTWKKPLGSNLSYLDLPDYPVVHVSQADAKAYCRWRNQRLPTEDEWEFSARGKKHRLFPWGDQWNQGNAVWNVNKMKPVRQIKSGATPEGIYDLAGNVWEWTSTTEGNKIILKGGSWSEANPANLRAAARRIENSGTTHSDDGFRCVRDVQSWSER